MGSISVLKTQKLNVTKKLVCFFSAYVIKLNHSNTMQMLAVYVKLSFSLTKWFSDHIYHLLKAQQKCSLKTCILTSAKQQTSSSSTFSFDSVVVIFSVIFIIKPKNFTKPWGMWQTF